MHHLPRTLISIAAHVPPLAPAAMSIEDAALLALRLGREIAAGARALWLGLGADGEGVARACVERWAAGRPFDPRDEGALDLLAERLAREVTAETQGTVEVIRGVRSNERGEDCLIVERRPLLTPRGQALADLAERLAAFRAAREAVLDRVAAETEVVRLMAGSRT